MENNCKSEYFNASLALKITRIQFQDRDDQTRTDYKSA